MRTRLTSIFPWLAAALLVAGTALAASDLPTVSTSQAGVTVKATPRALDGAVWAFELVFDTHSQDLSDDVMKTVALSAGGATLAPLKWQGDPPGGHHRKAVVQFKPLSPRPAAIELHMQRPGETKPRIFQWKLK